MAIAGFLGSLHDFVWGTSDQRSNPLENPNQKIDGRTIAQILGVEDYDGEMSMDADKALTFSAVYRSNRLLCDILGYLPLDVIERNKSGRIAVTNDHPASFLVSKEPSRILSSFNWRESSQANLNFQGNAFTEIRRKEGIPSSLKIHYPWNVKVLANQSRTNINYVVIEDGVERNVDYEDMIHVPGFGFDGISGKPILDVAKENFRSALYAQKYAAKFLKNDATPNGILINKTANKRQRDDARESWQQGVTGNNRGKIMVMPGDWEFQSTSIPPDQAQFLQTRHFSVVEIARWFGIPPHLLFELDRATFNNIEHQGIEFLLYTMNGWVKRWEVSLDRKLFSEEERRSGRFYTKFNTNALLRLDSKSRMEFYRGLWSIGGMTTNEIRGKEDMNPIKGGDRSFIQQGFAPIDRADDLVNASVTPKKEKADEQK